MLVIYIIAGFPDALLIPEISLAAFVCPGCMFMSPEFVIAKVPSCIGFQSNQDIFRLLCSIENDGMYVISPDIDRKKCPTAFRIERSTDFRCAAFRITGGWRRSFSLCFRQLLFAEIRGER